VKGTTVPIDGPGPAIPRCSASDDRGEGVISAAIVVLIMALIGAAMWVTFNGLWTDVSNRTRDEVQQIGGP
jgi:hypothetical protein